MKRKMISNAIAVVLALVMCVGLLPVSAFAAETADHTHNKGGWTCTQAEGSKKLNCTKHVHGDECYTVTEGEWTYTNIYPDSKPRGTAATGKVQKSNQNFTMMVLRKSALA